MVQLLTHKESHLSPPSGLMMQIAQTQTSRVIQQTVKRMLVLLNWFYYFPCIWSNWLFMSVI